MTRHTVCRRWLAPLSLALLLGGLALVLPAARVSANTLHVTDCGDAGANTLRGQIVAAGVGDTIVFNQNCTGATTITLATGTLTIATNNLTIDSNGHTVIVDGNNAVTVFTVNSGV